MKREITIIDADVAIATMSRYACGRYLGDLRTIFINELQNPLTEERVQASTKRRINESINNGHLGAVRWRLAFLDDHESSYELFAIIDDLAYDGFIPNGDWIRSKCSVYVCMDVHAATLLKLGFG